MAVAQNCGIVDLNTRTGVDLGTQIHVRIGAVDPKLFKPVKPNDYPRVKPRDGGFWTAQWDETHGGGWVQCCLGEGWGVRSSGTWNVWLLDPEPEARVLVIDSYADLRAAYERWPEPYRDASYDKGHLAWHLIAVEFDAVHLTDAGQWATRLSHPLSLYGWDCESTLWLRWAFAGVRHIGMRTFEERSYE